MSKEVESILGLNIIYADLESVLPVLPKYYDSEDINILLSYYNKEYSKASTRVTDDEVNGNSFHNLDHLARILKVNDGRSITLR